MAQSPHWNQPYSVCFQHLFEVAVGLDKDSRPILLFCPLSAVYSKVSFRRKATLYVALCFGHRDTLDACLDQFGSSVNLPFLIHKRALPLASLVIPQYQWQCARFDSQGAFHSTKITGSNFRNFRWSNGTCPTASQNSRSRAQQHKACWVKPCCVWKWRTFWTFSRL